MCLSLTLIQRCLNNVRPRGRTASAVHHRLLLGRILVPEAQRCYALAQRPSSCAWATQWIGAPSLFHWMRAAGEHDFRREKMISLSSLLHHHLQAYRNLSILFPDIIYLYMTSFPYLVRSLDFNNLLHDLEQQLIQESNELLKRSHAQIFSV